jgi:hypothetical protein
VKTNYKEMNMKIKTAISMLAVGVSAFAVQQVQANSFSETVLADLSGPEGTIDLTTTVTQAAPGDDYDYVYSFSSPIGLKAFTVDGVGDINFDTTGVNTASSANSNFGETATDIIADGFASWGSTTLQSGSETFGFFSPLAPISGTALAQDGGSYFLTPEYSADTLVPGVPDGGLTVALLGGAMTAMSLIRRKMV